VLRSPFEHPAASGITAAIDWYSIRIADAIASLPSTTVYENCFNVNGTSNPTYSINDPGGFCAQIRRDGFTGGRVSTEAPYSNLGAIETSGVDAQLNWRAAFGDLGLESVPGAVSAGIAVSYLLKYDTQPVPGAQFIENRGTLAQQGQFRYRSTMNLGYALGDWNVALTWQHLPSAKNASAATTPTTTLLGPDSYDLFDLTAGWTVSDTLALRLGIDNLFDEEPQLTNRNPGVNNGLGTTDAGYYDVLGRRVYLGAKLTF
jgi:iron complex outermembrane receptor protein